MSNIHLTLSSYKKPWDSTYRTQDGQVVYKVEPATPVLGAQDIKISKIIPSFFDNRLTTKGSETQNLRDSFAHLATVEDHTIHSSRIRMGSLDVATNDFLRKDKWSLINAGRLFIFSTLKRQCLSAITFRDRIFTGPDGREYLWKLRKTSCKARISERCKYKQRRLMWTIVAIRE